MQTVTVNVSLAHVAEVVSLVGAVADVMDQLAETGSVQDGDDCVVALLAAASAVCDAAIGDDTEADVEIETTISVEVELEAEAAEGEPGEVGARDEAGGGPKVCGLSAP